VTRKNTLRFVYIRDICPDVTFLLRNRESHSRRDITLYLFIGWVAFLTTRYRQITVRWDIVANAAVYCILFIVGGHFFCAGSIARCAGRPPAPEWPWKWT